MLLKPREVEFVFCASVKAGRSDCTKRINVLHFSPILPKYPFFFTPNTKTVWFPLFLSGSEIGESKFAFWAVYNQHTDTDKAKPHWSWRKLFDHFFWLRQELRKSLCPSVCVCVSVCDIVEFFTQSSCNLQWYLSGISVVSQRSLISLSALSSFSSNSRSLKYCVLFIPKWIQVSWRVLQNIITLHQYLI